MKPTEFARLVGASRQAVSKACATKRLDRSVTRDSQGRVVDIAEDLGRQEWTNAALPKHFDAVKARLEVASAVQPDRRARDVAESAPSLVFGGLEPFDAGRAFVGVRVPLGPFLAGAAAALEEAGEAATPEALRATVLSMGDEGWWVAVLAALNAAVDPEVPTDQLPAMWEAEGREAVAAARGGR